jgi:hypothetical protein
MRAYGDEPALRREGSPASGGGRGVRWRETSRDPHLLVTLAALAAGLLLLRWLA